MDRRNHKGYYIPGIISLTLLPIVFYFFTKREIRQSTIWAIPIIWADKAVMKKHDIVFSSFDGHYPPKRDYTEIVFTGNQLNDKIKLEFAQIRVREILKAGDTRKGLHFLFTDSSNYGIFIETVDKLRFEGAETYMPLENNLWFYHFQRNIYDCLLCNDVIHVEPKISWWTKNKENVSKIWRTSWQLIVLYCCFVILVFALRRQTNGS